jgi:short subunit dehydrogenase-like uncharacterized protein
MPNFLIYGANGYTGELIAREAVARGLRPILAGRSEAVAILARELGLESRRYSLDRAGDVEGGIHGVQAVLHCAGPFSHTANAMADVCLRTGVHYLDITGEVAVFAALAARDADAKAAGVMLLPGVGFDVVPTDCLAAHLKRRLPTATHLALGLQSLTRVSRGTAATIAESLVTGGMVRQAGVLEPVPAAWKVRRVDFGDAPVKCITIPWGDVVTAFYSTGIPNIEVYMAAPWRRRVAARLTRKMGWLLNTTWVQRFLKRKLRAGRPGPTADERARGETIIWGEVTDAAGGKAEARVHGPDGYTFTVRTALAVVAGVLAGDWRPGFQTPAMLFGPDFAMVEGVTRTDV